MEEVEYLESRIRELDEKIAELEALKAKRATLSRALCTMVSEKGGTAIVGPDGTRYPSMKAAARAAGKTPNCIAYRVEKGIMGWSRAVAVAEAAE